MQMLKGNSHEFYIYIYIYIYIYKHTYIHTHTHTPYIYIYIYIYKLNKNCLKSLQLNKLQFGLSYISKECIFLLGLTILNIRHTGE